MKKHNVIRAAVGVATAGAAGAAVGYAAFAATTWLRFGRPSPARSPEEQDSLLDAFIPTYDVVERHEVRVDAPAAVTLQCARDLDINDACLSRAIFKARELIMGAAEVPLPRGGLLPVMQRVGWGVLVDQPGREIVLGAVTRPWEPNPVFRSVPTTEFAAFREPGYVKIAFTLRADPIGDQRSLFRTETRAVATDARARRLFRRYWALVSPGVALIRVDMLNPIKATAENAVTTEH